MACRLGTGPFPETCCSVACVESLISEFCASGSTCARSAFHKHKQGALIFTLAALRVLHQSTGESVCLLMLKMQSLL